jgi:hypothetical protein
MIRTVHPLILTGVISPSRAYQPVWSKKTNFIFGIYKKLYLYIEKAGAEDSGLFTTTSLLNEE